MVKNRDTTLDFRLELNGYSYVGSPGQLVEDLDKAIDKLKKGK